MAVWGALSQKYLPGYEGYKGLVDGYQKLFDLLKTNKLARWERIVLLTTCTQAVVRAENFGEVAQAMETFYENYKGVLEGKVFHLDKQAEALRQLEEQREEKGWRGVCWNQTTLCGSAWWVNEESEDDPDGEGRPYNIDKDDKHWFVMDDVAPEPVAKEEAVV